MFSVKVSTDTRTLTLRTNKEWRSKAHPYFFFRKKWCLQSGPFELFWTKRI